MKNRTQFLLFLMTSVMFLALCAPKAMAHQDRSGEAESYLKKGVEYYHQNRLQEAVESLRRAVELDPGYAQAYSYLGSAYGLLGQWKEAIEPFKKAVQIKPDSALDHYNLALAYSHTGSLNKGIDSYKRALQIKPDMFEAHIDLGVSYGRTGLLEEALEELKLAARIKPDHARAHFSIGVAYTRLGKMSDAAEAFRQALRLDPEYAEAYYNLGRASLALGFQQDALEAFKQAISRKARLSELQLSQAYYGLGKAYAGLASFEEAVAALKQSLAFNPNYAEALNGLGASYIQLGRFNEAVEAQQQAVKLNSKLSEAHFNLGLAYLFLHEYGKSIEANKRAVDIDPNYLKARCNLGEAYARTGNKDEALKQYEFVKLRDEYLAKRLLNIIQTGSSESVTADNQASSASSSTQSDPKLQPESVVAVTSPVKLVSADEKRELSERLEGAAYTTIEVSSLEGSPILIKKARVKSLKRDVRQGATDEESAISDYAMCVEITLANTGAKPVGNIILQFTNRETGHIFYVGSIFENQNNTQVFIPMMLVTGDPSKLALQVVGVKFEDSLIWGSYPFGPPLPKANTAPPAVEVDTKPKPLNILHPLYTEEARRNKVQGIVRLRLEVSPEGEVGRVKVVNAIPDGLTEEAIRVVKQMKFNPASKNGEPLAYWVTTEVQFNIK